MKHNKYAQLHDICVKTVIAFALIAAPALASAPAAPDQLHRSSRSRTSTLR